jgi:putative membrane protein
MMWVPVVGVVAAAVWYVRAWLRRRETRRLWLFVSGLAVVLVASASPLAMLDRELLSAHMVQHLLLMLVAAPLLLLGSSGVVRAGPVVGLRKLGRLVTHPAFCWLAGTVTVIAWHVPALFALPFGSEWWHLVEHVSFLGGGLLFWWPVIQPGLSEARCERWAIPVYLFLATLPCDALSAYLAFCGHVVYPQYVGVGHLFGLSGLQDQEGAGALMWTCVTFGYMVPAALITISVIRDGGVRGRMREGAARG